MCRYRSKRAHQVYKFANGTEIPDGLLTRAPVWGFLIIERRTIPKYYTCVCAHGPDDTELDLWVRRARFMGGSVN